MKISSVTQHAFETGARWAALLVAFVAGGSTLRAEPARHLFLDPAMVLKMEKAALRVNPAQQREVVIHVDQPWEQRMISLFLTVREEEGKLRMWYICRDGENHPNVAYAESKDGVQWTKPKLGIVEHQGSPENDLEPIEGFGADDCNALRTNSTHAQVSWKGGADLSALAGKAVRLDLRGNRTKLYSFRFE